MRYGYSEWIRRWLTEHDSGIIHAIVEYDSGFTKTLCGQILRGGKIMNASRSCMETRGGVCPTCLARTPLYYTEPPRVKETALANDNSDD